MRMPKEKTTKSPTTSRTWRKVVKQESEPRPLTLREKLDIIDGWLCEPEGGKELSAVLSAIRGPDKDGMHSVKADTTAVIRTKAFPKLRAAKYNWVTHVHVPWGMAAPTHRLNMTDAKKAGEHFARHIRKAAEALGLRV